MKSDIDFNFNLFSTNLTPKNVSNYSILYMRTFVNFRLPTVVQDKDCLLTELKRTYAGVNCEA